VKFTERADDPTSEIARGEVKSYIPRHFSVSEFKSISSNFTGFGAQHNKSTFNNYGEKREAEMSELVF